MSDKKQLDWSNLLRLIKYTNPYKRLFYWCIFLAIILAPISTISPYIVKTIVDEHILVSQFDGLYLMASLFAGVVLLNVVLRYFFIYSISDLGQLIIKDMRIQTFSHITSLRSRFFDQTPIGNTTTRTINDISAINDVFTQGVITIVADLLAVFTVIAIMFYTSWRLTLICLAVMPFLIIATYIFKEAVKTSYQNVRSQLSKMNSFLQERITGMQIVQIFAAEKQEMDKFKKINRDYTQANLNSVLYYATFFPVVELISSISLALMVWIGARGYISEDVTFGALVAFPLYLNMLYRPIRLAADKFNTLQMGLVAAGRVYSILDNDSIIPDEGTEDLIDPVGSVEFDEVSFAYDEKTYVLNDISFKVDPGDTLAIVGSTGSGKSTIINVLNRFYDYQKGEVLLDGRSIREYKTQSLRENISIVLQDVFLFGGTVYENITLMDGRFTKEEVHKASEIIGADKYIENLPGGYDFVITERGNNLSVGQRQLISFVRALIFNPAILILDEATSSIDPETELVIQHAIEKLIERRTSIVIAHRLSTIRNADKIMVLDQGRVVEIGSHEELVQLQDGRYRELYEMQLESEAV